MTNEILTEPEAAEFLRKGLSTVQELRRKRSIPHLPGKPARYLRASLLAWEQAREVQARSPEHPTHQTPAPRQKRNVPTSEKAKLKGRLLSNLNTETKPKK